MSIAFVYTFISIFLWGEGIYWERGPRSDKKCHILIDVGCIFVKVHQTIHLRSSHFPACKLCHNKKRGEMCLKLLKEA